MSRSTDALNLAKELNGIGLQGSVTDERSLESLFSAALDTYGHVDVVVNNTGDPARGDLLDLASEQWHADMDLILLNVIRMARIVTPHMLSRKSGAIVNISAADAYEPDLRFPIGSTLRAALGAWTKLYSDRYAKEGIRMNCVLPGIIFPPGWPADRADVRARVPVGRAGSYEEIAEVVAFLLSAKASYITGQNIRVDGGLVKYV
uniref:Enoyl-(Acyl carrier) reductase family protein n=2 Tax=Rhizobium rhizogenes TaxID=359 RepID=A0A7S4ZV97_RHIRH|nr:enoyl-(Acyl carrier) reductase family protein [Rhizobium rhizogenes]